MPGAPNLTVHTCHSTLISLSRSLAAGSRVCPIC